MKTFDFSYAYFFQIVIEKCDRAVNVHGTATVKASLSYNPDKLFEGLTNLEFQWGCMRVGPDGIQSECMSESINDELGELILSNLVLTNG